MEPEITVAAPVWGQLERHWLDATSWVDIGRGWLDSTCADQTMDALREGVA